MDSIMNLIKGKNTLEAISILKNQLDTLHNEVQVLGDLTNRLPFITSLVRDAESKLTSLLDAQEKKVRDTCKALGLSNPDNLAMLQHYTQQPPAYQVSGAAVVIRRALGLPWDLVEEILCRVPATYLKRLRSTCKRWNRLFKYDWTFAKKHSDKATKEFMILMLTKKFRICPMSINLQGIIPSLEVEAELSLIDNSLSQFDIYQVFHCDGLLLCTSIDLIRLVVWNPNTGQTRWIEANKHFPNIRRFALGYLQDKRYSNKSYKILSYGYGGEKDSEIYDFSSDSWKILDHDISPGWSTGYPSPRVSLKGQTCWFAQDCTNVNTQSLHIFDFSTEKSSLLGPLPHQFDGYVATSLSIVREEKLSVLLKQDLTSKTEVWVTNKIDETNVVSWSKFLVLDLNSCDVIISWDASFLLDEEKKVIVCCSRWIDLNENKMMTMIYVLGEDNQVTQVDFGVHTTDACWPTILSYVPSLAQINGGGGKRKRAD